MTLRTHLGGRFLASLALGLVLYLDLGNLVGEEHVVSVELVGEEHHGTGLNITADLNIMILLVLPQPSCDWSIQP